MWVHADRAVKKEQEMEIQARVSFDHDCHREPGQQSYRSSGRNMEVMQASSIYPTRPSA